MKKIKIALIEDDVELNQAITEILLLENYDIAAFRTFEDFIFKLKDCNADIILTDRQLPGANGIKLINAIREINKVIPIIMISGTNTTESAVEAINMGANDFVPKPINFPLLLAKINQLIGYKSEQIWQNLIMNDALMVLSLNDQIVKLTQTEFDIFKKLFESRTHIVARQSLLDSIHGRSLDVHIHSLRKKIKIYDLKIETEKNKGYRLLA